MLVLISNLIEILILLILIEGVVSYLILFGVRISARHPLVRGLRSIVNPLLNPVRRRLPLNKTSGWDFSPVIVILLLGALQRLVLSR